jgi:hypothetical protein
MTGRAASELLASQYRLRQRSGMSPEVAGRHAASPCRGENRAPRQARTVPRAELDLSPSSAVEDVDLDDLSVSHREDGPRCVWHPTRRATALPVAASHVESAQLLSA